MIHVALGVRNTANYIVHSLVCICSVLSNTSEPVHIHIIHDSTLSPEDQSCCERLVAHFQAKLSLHPVDIESSPISQLVPECFGIGCLYRLFIPELIPEPRVIYFDSDICCNMNVADIITEADSIQDFNLLVVQDEGICREVFSRYIQKHGINPRMYFNSGFIVFNTARINAEIPHFFDSIVNIIRTTGKLRFGDQDALNLYFLQKHAQEAQSGLHYLPERFNLNIGVKDRHLLPASELSNTVVHYAYIKPWEKIFPASMVYWKYREKMFEILQPKS